MVRKWFLGDRGLEYIREELNNGSNLARLIRELPLADGVCETFLPEPLEIQSVPDLALSVYLSKDISLADARAIFQNKILTYLQSAPGNCALIETFHTPEKTAFIAAGSPYLICENNVFFYLTQTTSKSVLEDAIAAGKTYPKIIVLTRHDGDIPTGTTISARDLHAFARNVAFLMVGAFDEESYISWSRRGI